LDKEGAEPNYKGFGHHPLARLVWHQPPAPRQDLRHLALGRCHRERMEPDHCSAPSPL